MFPYSSRENAVRRVLLPSVLREVGKGVTQQSPPGHRDCSLREARECPRVRSTAPACTVPQHPVRLTSTPLLCGSELCLRASESLGEASNHSSSWERLSYAHRSAGTPGTGTIVLASIFFFFLLFLSFLFSLLPSCSSLSCPFLSLRQPQVS